MSPSPSDTFQLRPEEPTKKKSAAPRKKTEPHKAWSKHAEGRSYEPATAQPEELWFRHTWWKPTRVRVRDALVHSLVSPRALQRFDNCGADAHVYYSEDTKKYSVRAEYCHSRHCQPCMKAKANLLAANLRARLAVNPKGRYRFITLTLRHNTAPLPNQVKRLYSSFTKLRASKLWKSTQRGGVAVLEVKYNAASDRWHPHLHVIAEGDFLKQTDLSRAWHKATGDSQVVDIRALNSGQDAAHYVSKYVSKGTNNDVWNNATRAQEWVHAMHGVRTAAT